MPKKIFLIIFLGSIFLSFGNYVGADGCDQPVKVGDKIIGIGIKDVRVAARPHVGSIIRCTTNDWGRCTLENLNEGDEYDLIVEQPYPDDYTCQYSADCEYMDVIVCESEKIFNLRKEETSGPAGPAVCPICPESQRKGFVPCARKCDNPKTLHCECDSCQFCHFFIMLDTIFDFIMFPLAPTVATLMLVIGGVMFFFAGAKPEAMKTGKDIIFSALLGLAIIFTAWIVINTLLGFMGVAVWTGLESGWWQINCPISP